MFASNTSQVSSDANWIEECFQSYLYTGNGSTQTITNGIDLAGKGGLVWIKNRSDVKNNILVDTARGANNWIASNLTNAQASDATKVSSFSSTGFTVGSDSTVNLSTQLYASWNFRKQPKFFDVVTYTGNGTSQNIAHNLGSVPGCIIVKSTSTVNDWRVYHRSLATVDSALRLNSTAAAGSSSAFWNSTAPTSTQFTVGSDGSVNANGATYVAYLFAHNAGGFGLTGTDNVISCGSFTTDAGGAYSVTLGYEPQWVMIKRTDSTQSWLMFDNMRGLGVAGNSRSLFPNLSDAESGANNFCAINSTGFTGVVNASASYIYVVVRRGPMKTPTSGTSVFSPVARAGTSADATVSAGFPPDSLLVKNRGGSVNSVDWSFNFFDKLRSPGYRLSTAFTDAEDTSINFITSFDQNGVTLPATGYTATNGSGYNYINYFFRRAPGFFDEVCWTTDGTSNQRVSHNLTVAPELIITKARGTTSIWYVYTASGGVNQYLRLNTTAASTTFSAIWGTAPTSSTFGMDTGSAFGAGVTQVAYLFASCPGVSKVGSYTGNGSSQTINCGFTGGARFVMIKRTDSTGDWYVWDTARGIVSANDPRLSLNTTAAEVTTDDSIDPDNSGFIVNQVTATNINVSSATYIYLAIA